MKKIAHWIAYHPKMVLIVCLLLIIPAAVSYFNTFINYDILTYLPENLDSVKGEQILDKTFHNAASSIIICEDMSVKDVQQLKAKIQKVDGVSQVIWADDLCDITVPQEILPDVMKNTFYSFDGKSTLMMVQYENGGATDETMNAIKEIRSIMNENVYMAGISAITADTKNLADSQAPIYIAIAIALALIALSFTMTSWVLPFIVLAALGVAVIYNMGTNIFFGQISYITQCIAAILQLGVTMDYSVFLIDRFEEEKKHFDSKPEAMAHAINSTFTSLCGSSLTTIFGFLALCFMSFTLGLDIGLVMAKGVLFGVLTVVILLPALVLLFDNLIVKTEHKSLIPNFNKLNGFLIKHKKALALFFVLLIIPAYFCRTNINVYYNMDKALPQDLSSIVSLNKMKDSFNMATTHFVIVDDNISESKLSMMTEEMKDVDGITNVLSLNSFIGAAIPSSILPDEIKQICVKDGKQLMMLNTSYSAASDEENTQIDNLEKIVKKYDDTGYITGEGVLTKDLISITDRDFTVTSAISIAAIFILIMIIFKSVSIPFILIASIELAILVNLALSFIFGTPVSFIGPTVIGCVQLSATVDYAILLSTRFREEIHKGLSKTEAIHKAANESDRSIFQSALVFFCATFGVYLTCNITIIKEICSLLARGSIISALIIIFLLTPILLVSEGIISKTSIGWRKPYVRKSKRNKIVAENGGNKIETSSR